MIEQKATVISRDIHQVWVEAERQSTCGQCQARKGCGTGLLAKHVGQRFSRIAVKTSQDLRVGQQVMVTIPEQALLSGAVMMYLLPLLLMFVTAALARIANSGELVEIIAGLSGLVAGFYFVKSRLKNKNTGVQVKTIEDFK
ncbi:Sigma factor RpoE regulatory protein RseC [Methylophaga thiooxydans]|uniref:Positive regulator of sigma(E), RseC/MucC superfamily n=2 Tax=Methylophaga thiooxydans TaxID=392484 RepID=C0N4S0_9GAMM|nr:SoxR reducing system RseC family protein [Methylophaga thiooxydans]EEF80290.1 Positive regulator of sigma(E), RseC/MucC superfamily [Methylophaga thiooxydans DMS010]KGM06036.1 Sigma factor RpoE regulatory protein RseC [Methylophaga thiooxydans]